MPDRFDGPADTLIESVAFDSEFFGQLIAADLFVIRAVDVLQQVPDLFWQLLQTLTGLFGADLVAECELVG